MEPYVTMGLFFTICYFFVLVVCFPLAAQLDRYIYDGYVRKGLSHNDGRSEQSGPAIKIPTYKDLILGDWMT